MVIISGRKPKKITVGEVFNIIILILITVIMLYPIVYIFSMSISGVKHIILRDIWLFPKDLSFESYKLLLQTNDIWVAYLNTIIYTVVGTIIGLLVTVSLSYAVSQKRFRYRRIVIWYMMITMFFSGGMIPLYILINDLEMINTLWAIVLPGAASAWYMVICRTYFATISASLFESAELDGAGELKKFFVIAIPLAKPIIAVLALYYIVGYWNTYFSAVIYLDDMRMHPIQNYLEKLLYQNNSSGSQGNEGGFSGAIQVEQMKYSAIVLTMFPIMAVYPFLQKHFAKGIMVGSIKE